MESCKRTFQRVGEFYSACADKYGEDKWVRVINNLALFTSAVLTIGACLNIDPITRLNQESAIPLALITVGFFGVPPFINSLRKIKGGGRPKSNSK